MPNVLLAVCGGISAYKSCELLRILQKHNVSVRVMMTPSAEKFVTRLTFESLTRSPVYTDLFGDGAFGTAHIDIARWADLLVFAPLTANTLSKLARGAADDFVSTVYLAYRGPVTVAPAMNSAMWENEAVQENLAVLKRRGVTVIDPTAGELACGEIGIGKMEEPQAIADAICRQLEVPKSPLSGKHVVITAGPTREYIDPVRFLSNPSSGKMGMAVAREAARRGGRVTVIHGPMEIEPQENIRFVAVGSAREMAQAVSRTEPFDIFVGTAAVSDYRPAKPSSSKIKKRTVHETLELEKTEDILKEVSNRKRPGDIVVGFAAETENVVSGAREKLKSKDLDLVVANRVFKEQKGFVQDVTDVDFIDRSLVDTKLAHVTKQEVAVALWNRVEKIVESRT